MIIRRGEKSVDGMTGRLRGVGVIGGRISVCSCTLTLCSAVALFSCFIYGSQAYASSAGGHTFEEIVNVNVDLGVLPLQSQPPQTKFSVSEDAIVDIDEEDSDDQAPACTSAVHSGVQILMGFSNHTDTRYEFSSNTDHITKYYTYGHPGHKKFHPHIKKTADEFIFLRIYQSGRPGNYEQRWILDDEGEPYQYVCDGPVDVSNILVHPTCTTYFNRIDDSGVVVEENVGSGSDSDFEPYYQYASPYHSKVRFYKMLTGLKRFYDEMTKEDGSLKSVCRLTVVSDFGRLHIKPYEKDKPIITKEFLSGSAPKVKVFDNGLLRESVMLAALAGDSDSQYLRRDLNENDPNYISTFKKNINNFFSSKPKDFKIVMAVATNTLEMDQVASLKAKMSGSVKEHAYEFMGVVSDTSHQAVTELASTYNAEDETGLFDIYDVNHSIPVWEALMTAVKARITKYATEKVFKIADLPVVSVKYGRTTASEAETLHSYYWREDKKQGSDRKLRIKQIGLGEATHIFLTYKKPS